MSADLSNPIFHDEEAAREWFEARVWPNGPVCPHCKAENRATLMKGKSAPRGPLPVQRLPRAVHGHCRDAL